MKLFLSLVIAVSALTSVYGQQSERARIAHVRVACVSFSGDLRTLSFPARGRGWDSTSLSIRYPSPVKRMRVVKGYLHFYDPNNLPSAEKPAAPVAKVRLPSSGSRFTVLLMPGKKAEGELYQGIAIADSQFNYGGCCMLNMTKVPITMEVNGKKQPVLAPRKPVTIDHRLNGAASKVAKVKLYAAKTERPFFSANWNLRSDIREAHIIYIDPRNKRPKIKTILDARPRVEAAQTP